MCEHIGVSLEEGGERAFLFLPQLCPHGHRFLGIIPETNRLGEGGAVGRTRCFVGGRGDEVATDSKSRSV
jgi:hypothetical protein